MTALVLIVIATWTAALIAFVLDVRESRRCIERIARAMEEESRRG